MGNETIETKDCKTCANGEALFCQDKADRFTSTYKPTGYVKCSKPGYKGGRFYFCRDSKRCPAYVKRERA